MPSQDNPTNTMPPVMPTDQSSKPSGSKIKKSTDPVATSPVVVRPDGQSKKPTPSRPTPDDSQQSSGPKFTDPARVLSEIASRIGESHNILVTLSADPSVDEMSAAIGLTLYLDRIGKRVTAIYSGITPNALEFLKPEDTFEQKADMLQDFVIAINKDKADHLRYKLDGDYVKIFITPYRSSISSDDLEFTYGDFNVDLVIALDVANVSDLDAALREHGRIVHDAPVINITTGDPGKLGGIEWSDKSASSVSEMLAELVRSLPDGVKMARDEATAFLTGIVAATNRFAGPSTTPRTMEVASRLMSYGANQQLISKNITSNVENEILGSDTPMQSAVTPAPTVPTGPTELNIGHGGPAKAPVNRPAEAHAESSTSVDRLASPVPDSSLLDDLKAAEATFSDVAGEALPEIEKRPSHTAPADAQDVHIDSVASRASSAPTAPPPEVVQSPIPRINLQPTHDHATEEAATGATPSTTLPHVAQPKQGTAFANPAAARAPEAATAPEINGVPEINYMPLPDDEVLPPPPAPPIDFDTTFSAPPATSSRVSSEIPTQPVRQPSESTSALPNLQPLQPASPQTNHPGDFKIPGL